LRTDQIVEKENEGYRFMDNVGLMEGQLVLVGTVGVYSKSED